MITKKALTSINVHDIMVARGEKCETSKWEDGNLSGTQQKAEIINLCLHSPNY